MKGDGCGAVRLTDNPERSYGSQVWFRHLIPLLAAATTAAVASAGIADRLQPSQLVYLGAFRLPPVMSDSPAVWEWGGGAMTFYPAGDPAGGSDGFPGSLFLTGLDSENWVSEIGIPAPSLSRDVEELPEAVTLQPLADVRGGLFATFTELPRVGLEYLPAQAGQQAGVLHLAWGQHYHEDPGVTIAPTHGWCDLDLAHPDTQGPWWIGTAAENEAGFIYSVNDYLFTIPDAWADTHTGGRRLATGRFRDGGWSGMGPSLIAYGPWLDEDPSGTPPPANAELSHVPLILYSSTLGNEGHRLAAYSNADAWTGGAWITSGSRSAVVFAGTKGSGYTWYGFYTPEGVDPPPLFGEGAPCVYTVGDIMCVRPDGETACTQEDMAPCLGAPTLAASRGWWASRFDAVLMFYDPDDLASVAAGSLGPYEPQPYAMFEIDEHLFLNAAMPDVAMYNGYGDQRKGRLGAVAFDRGNGLLYVLEQFADEYRPLVHVWKVQGSPAAQGRPPARVRGRARPARVR
ncbi:MAG: hypothetical protein LJE95_12675 [Acidobacteria bacterium]|jgi:hypothetical protein|nr:hypothetical protein [Acidobacteriota bacterium]